MVLMWRSIPAVSYRLIYGGIGREVVVAGGGGCVWWGEEGSGWERGCVFGRGDRREGCGGEEGGSVGGEGGMWGEGGGGGVWEGGRKLVYYQIQNSAGGLVMLLPLIKASCMAAIIIPPS